MLFFLFEWRYQTNRHGKGFLRHPVYQSISKYINVISCITLKNVRKTCPVEKQQRRRARKVVIPPFATAGPMLATAVADFSCREPEIGAYITSQRDVL